MQHVLMLREQDCLLNGLAMLHAPNSLSVCYPIRLEEIEQSETIEDSISHGIRFGQVEERNQREGRSLRFSLSSVFAHWRELTQIFVDWRGKEGQNERM